jgi:hypothetical protein
MSGLAELGNLWHSIQAWLFPVLEDELGELDDRHREFIAICEICEPRKHLAAYRWVGNGCPPKNRLALCKAFIAKAVWNFPTTSALIDDVCHRPTLRRLCGWETISDIPGESTFSLAFRVFARDELPQSIHHAMLKEHYADKIAGHISRDATAIHAREKAAKKEPKPGPPAFRRRWPVRQHRRHRAIHPDLEGRGPSTYSRSPDHREDASRGQHNHRLVQHLPPVHGPGRSDA